MISKSSLESLTNIMVVCVHNSYNMWCVVLLLSVYLKSKNSVKCDKSAKREHNQAKTVENEGEPVSFVLKTAVFCCLKVEFVLNLLSTFHFLLSTFQFLLSTVHSLLLHFPLSESGK